MKIYSKVFKTDIGYLRIKSSENDITEVSILSKAPKDLSDPEMVGSKHPKILKDLENALMMYFDGKYEKLQTFPFPHLEGTDFERNVWKTLKKIPFGKTMSYGEVAKALGKPGPLCIDRFYIGFVFFKPLVVFR
jgi:methylated-DNA-[protein]-cysteine S-methyltransferase